MEKSLGWLIRVAGKLRERGEKPGSSDMPEFWEYVPVIVSRQSGGQGKHDRSREIGVFMLEMVNAMVWACGKPSHYVVAMMANIAFPRADLNEDHVLAACKRAKRAVQGR